MLSSQNSGKYFTRTYWRDKEAGERDKSGLTAAELSFLEIQDGEAQAKFDLERLREKTDGILHDN